MDVVSETEGPATGGSNATATGETGRLLEAILSGYQPHLLPQQVLSRLMATGDTDLMTVRNIISENAALAGKVLSLVNSAAMGICNEVTSVHQAVALLGAKKARSVAMAFALRILMGRLNLPQETIVRLWAGALRKANAAQWFCQLLDSAQADTAYTIALLQDIGLPVMMNMDPAFYEKHFQAANAGESLIAAECGHFGFDHGIVGSSLLARWGVAESVWSGVMQHHLHPSEEELGGSHHWSWTQLAVFFSGLLPHLKERINPRAEGWLRAIHTRFLSSRYASFELFLMAVDSAVQEATNRTFATLASDPHLTSRVMDELAGSTIEMTGSIFRLEAVLNVQQQDANELRCQAFADPLTKLLNRRGFISLMKRRFETAVEKGGGMCCVIIDIDDFKAVNDTYSHAAGDQLLRGVSILLRSAMPANAVLGRLGGDEFGAAVFDITEPQARDLARTLAGKLEGRRLRLLPEVEVTLHASIGIAFFEQCHAGHSHDEMLRIADEAMYQRKKNGKHGTFFLNTSEPGNVLFLERTPRCVTRGLPRPMPRPW